MNGGLIHAGKYKVSGRLPEYCKYTCLKRLHYLPFC